MLESVRHSSVHEYEEPGKLHLCSKLILLGFGKKERLRLDM